MNIVIVGAGDVGLYMASLLSKQKHNVILIDKNGAKLEELAWQMDVAIREGSGTDWQLIGDLLEIRPDLFLALTNNDEVNLVSCSIAKNLGYPRTIARVKDNRFLNRIRLDFARLFNVDYFISPELLVAYDIYKNITSPGFLAFENFAHGEVQMRTLRVPASWSYYHLKLAELRLPKGIMIALIYRFQDDQPGQEAELIFPHGTDRIFPGDEVTLIGERDQMAEIHHFFGLSIEKVDNVVIVGGSLVGVNLAKILQEHRIQVRLIDRNHRRCLELAEEFPDCHIIHHDGTDLDFLLSEKMSHADYFVMCTGNEEVNVLGGLVAKEAGCEKVAIILSNNRFMSLVNRLGVVHVVSPKLAVANRVISLAASKAVTSLVSLYENEAEILEITVSLNSKIIGIPLSEIGPQLPKDFLIAMIQNRGRITIAKGDSIICPGDTVIVVSNPKYFQDLEKIF
ncbi:potassium uptake system, Trk family [Candidatus Protochlamydia naegleriophila]|uniref:Trk system potassium uptake protein TrkA n=1 Tax=Candidatus Protochlamydia naegleriophila TaxID=389348 RepID=A0A0U5EUJ2_9BACT|nr:Trk system potassium transporter TrkA [Candidatus Protochlamydia naegleriophila]CUI17920.1 potassium uptake system, Trk family [Candidatus Protochlamydia naegleriophila]